MLALGLLLIIVAVLVGVGAIYEGGESATVEFFGQTLTTTIAGVFVAGAVAMFMLLLGVWLLMASMGRARRKRVGRKEAKQNQKQSVQQLEEERTALQAENERLAGKLAETGPPTSGSTAGTNDRVIDRSTDLTAQEQASRSGRHSDPT